MVTIAAKRDPSSYPRERALPGVMAGLPNEDCATTGGDPSRNGELPVPQDPCPRHGSRRNGGRWETIRYALDTNPRTFRLCLILFVATVVCSSGVAAVVMMLVRHML